ncbi:MAG TPA: hypothetical protein VNO22_07660 [Planctomycetota bacterium]|nr:hypothetical protein [Planctomycetota bacterium]
MAEKDPRKKKAGKKGGAARARKARGTPEEAQKRGESAAEEGRTGPGPIEAPEVPPGTPREGGPKGEAPGEARREEPPAGA